MKKIIKRMFPILLALTLAFGSCLTVFASDYPSNREAVYNAIYNYAVSNGCFIGKYQIFNHQGGYSDSPATYTLYTSDTMPYFSSNGNGTLVFAENSGQIVTYTRYIYSVTNDGEITVDDYTKSTDSVVTLVGSSYGHSTLADLYYNFDIVRLGETEPTFEGYSGFFLKMSPLVAATRVVAPEKALKEVISLIPLSILFLAGCLGLRKALRFLLSTLRRA